MPCDGGRLRDNISALSSIKVKRLRGGMLWEKPMAVALIKLARATNRAREVYRGESYPSETTVGRKRVLVHALGGQERMTCLKVSSSKEHLG